MGLKAVFFDLDDTLYTSFQAGDAYAYEKLEEWAISTFGDKGKGFADEFLDELRAAGVKVAICTNMLADIQMEKLEYLGIADKVDCLVTSEEAGVDKPGSAIFWLAMHKCRCLPEETVMVGDNFTHDIQGALDVGIDGVWLNWTDKPKPVGELSYTEVSTFEQAAAHIRTLL